MILYIISLKVSTFDLMFLARRNKASLFVPSFSGVDFGYACQKPLFRNVDFGIDMESRSKSW